MLACWSDQRHSSPVPLYPIDPIDARIAPLQPPYKDSVRRDLERVVPPPHPPLALYRAVAKNEVLFRRLVDGELLGLRGLLDLGQIAKADREVLILRTCALGDAEYEWGVHVAYFGAASGLTPRQIKDTAAETVDPDVWSARHRLLLHLVDALVQTHGVPDALFAELRETFSEAELVEFTALVGIYLTVSLLCNLTGVKPEAGAPRFPQAPA